MKIEKNSSGNVALLPEATPSRLFMNNEDKNCELSEIILSLLIQLEFKLETTNSATLTNLLCFYRLQIYKQLNVPFRSTLIILV